MRRDRGAAGERRTRGTGEAAMTGRATAVGIVVALVVMVAEREAWAGAPTEQLRTQIDGDQTTVRSRLITKQGMEIPVDYRMHRASGDRWLTYDVAIEGVSLVANYRAQFNKIIQTSGYTSLVKKLAAKEQEGMQADRELTVKKASQTR